jgi:glucokinase
MKQSGRESHVRWSSGESGIGPGRPELLREVNARQVLRLLRLHGPCSRADLVRSSGLSAPTISSGIAYLQKKGLVEPIGPGPSNGGRPPDLLRFNSKLGYVVGADIGTSVVRIALADLDGTVIEEWVAPTHSHSTPERVASLIGEGIDRLQKHQNVPSKKLLGLAAGVPGITDTRAGIVLSAPILPAGWQAVPLRKILEAKTGIPTVVENDVNLAALGESWRGTARGVKDFVFLTIGTGVGAGIFVNGRLYHGSDWAAGEIGYLYVPGTEETPLAIRRPGSLESIIGARAIRHSWQKLCNGNRKTSRDLSRNISEAEILDFAEKGESHAVEILQRTARILADAITNVCVILNSSLVVLGGRVGSHSALFKATARIVERNEFCRPRLALSDLGSEAPLLGAIWLVLKTVEGRILPPPPNSTRPVTTEEASGFLQSFLALPQPDQEILASK